MTTSINTKSVFNLTPVREEAESNFNQDLYSLQLLGLNPFQLEFINNQFLEALKEDAFPEQREKFQNLIEPRLALYCQKKIDPFHILKLRYFLPRIFDAALNRREPIFKILDLWIDREMISLEDGVEISELVKNCLFTSRKEEIPQLKINKPSLSEKLLSFKERALLLDDHIALFSKVIETIRSSHLVDKGQEFDAFLEEFLFCLQRQNKEIKSFYIERLKKSCVLETFDREGVLLELTPVKRALQTPLIPSAQLEHRTATPKCVIASARYWYTRAFDEQLHDRDPFCCFLDYLLDQGCISFKEFERLWSVVQEINGIWNARIHTMTKLYRLEQQAEAVEFHIGPRFGKAMEFQNTPLSQKMMVGLFSHLFFSPCPHYAACFIRLIKESAQELRLDAEESIQIFKAYFDCGSGSDYEFLYNLSESHASLDALFRFDSYFNENPDDFISVFSQLNQEQIYCLAKGYIDGGVSELEQRLSKMSIDGNKAEKFLKIFESKTNQQP